jgi:cobalamin biosynthetic protein CobC
MDGNMRLRDEIGNRTAGLRIHGGRVDLAASLYPFAPQPWIDLSTGINPICWPVPQLPAALYQRLPLARQTAEVAAAAAETYGLPAGAMMIPVPGSELAIRLLPRIGGARRVRILAPTYGSHAVAWRDAGAEVQELDALPDPGRHDLEMLVVVNPNNPDGRTFARTDLAAFAQAWTATGRRLVVDEAFADLRPEMSLLALPKLPVGTTVLRSFGKFFGLAGLRVGFVVVGEADGPAWHSLLGDWPVSGPACEIATSALRDKAWIAATRTRLAADRKRLDALLGAAGLKLIGGTNLFGLFEAAEDLDLLDHFARAGILIRGFATTPQRCRFGLPADEAAWQRLETACRTLKA